MQIVGYERTDPEPGLLVSHASATSTEPESVDFISLDAGTELAYSLGDRRCAGAVSADGHRPCDADEAPYCPQHTSTWVCARCTGICLKDEMDCYDEHAIYLAAFAPDTFKVGVTRLWRLEQRLREQGADRAAHIRTVDDGRRARRIEADIADRIPDRVRVPTKRAGLHQTVDQVAWGNLLDEFDPIDTFAFDYGLDLCDQPMAETLATGTVRGTKGRLLVLDHAGSTYAVDMRDLVGYELERERTERDVQSSLGAFQ